MNSQPAGTDSGSARVLLVDDNLVNQRVLEMLLSRSHHRVTAVNSGLEALSVLDREPFDLVLMDVMMPEMDGLRCTRLIRQRERATGGHIPIIAVTAYASDAERQRCLQAGMDEFLSKPVCADELAGAMSRQLGRPLETGEGGAPEGASEEREWLRSLRAMDFDDEGIAQLVAAFEKTVPERLAQLRDAVGGRDADAVQKIAHTIKGALAVFSDGESLTAVDHLLEHGPKPSARDDAEQEEALLALESGVIRLLASMSRVRERTDFRDPSGAS